MRDARSRGALDAVFERTAEHLNAQAKEVRRYSESDYVHLVQSLPFEQRGMLHKARERSYRVTISAFDEMVAANSAIRTWWWPHVDDRRFMAEVRCHIIDAEWNLSTGRFEDAVTNLESAVQQLTWIIKERRYGGDRRGRQPPSSEVHDAAMRVIESLSHTAEQMRTLARSAA